MLTRMWTRLLALSSLVVALAAAPARAGELPEAVSGREPGASPLNEKLRFVVPFGPLAGSKVFFHVNAQLQSRGRVTVHVNGQLLLTTDGGPPWDAIVHFNGRVRADLRDLDPVTVMVHARLVVPGRGLVGRIQFKVTLDPSGTITSIAPPELVMTLVPDLAPEIPDLPTDSLESGDGGPGRDGI